MKWEIYKDVNKQWRWRLKAANGKIVADSAEAYNHKGDCMRMVDLIRSHAAESLMVFID